MENLVNKLYPLVENKKTLDAETIQELANILKKSVSAEQTDLVIVSLREIVAKWRRETKGVVSFETEATFELAVEKALSADIVVETAKRVLWVTSFLQMLVSCCRVVNAEVPSAVDATSPASVVDEVSAVVNDSSSAVVAVSADAVAVSADAAVVAVSADADSVAPVAPVVVAVGLVPYQKVSQVELVKEVSETLSTPVVSSPLLEKVVKTVSNKSQKKA